MLKPVIALLLAALVIFALCSCSSTESKHEQGRIRVVCTTGMITDIVRETGGDRVRVRGLMGSGVDPHLYKPTEGDVQRLADAQIIFYNGLHLEAKMAEIFERMRESGKRTVAVTERIPHSQLLAPPQFEGQFDPHVWFDVTFWLKAAERVRDGLIEVAPEHRDYFTSRSQEYTVRLNQLHEYVLAQAARLPREKRVLITAHDAFNYFGRAYGFEVRGLQGISTAAEAGTADVQSLARFIAQQKIPAIFVESSVPPRTVEAVKEAVRARGFQVEIGGELFSDALGSDGTPEGTYIGMVRHNIDTIVNALLQEGNR